MVVKCPCAFEIALFALENVVGDGLESLVVRNESRGLEVLAGRGGPAGVDAFFEPLDPEAEGDGFLAIVRAEGEEQYAVAVFGLAEYLAFAGCVDGYDLDGLEGVGGGHRYPHSGGGVDVGECGPVEKIELVTAGDGAEHLRGGTFYGEAVPCFVALLLPDVKWAPVELVGGGFGDGHVARVAGEEEIDVVDISVDGCEVDAREMTSGAEVSEVFGVDANQLETELAVFVSEVEISFAQAGSLGDVLFDAILYVPCYDVGYVFGRRLGLVR